MAWHCSLSSARWMNFTLSHPFQIGFKAILPPTPKSSKLPLLLEFSTKIMQEFLIFLMRNKFAAYHIILDLTILLLLADSKCKSPKNTFTPWEPSNIAPPRVWKAGTDYSLQQAFALMFPSYCRKTPSHVASLKQGWTERRWLDEFNTWYSARLHYNSYEEGHHY